MKKGQTSDSPSPLLSYLLCLQANVGSTFMSTPSALFANTASSAHHLNKYFLSTCHGPGLDLDQGPEKEVPKL